MLLNELKRIFLHIRWPLQTYTLLGFLFGLVIAKVIFNSKIILSLVSLFFLWSGVTLLNSYYDKDEKPVAGLKNPPKVTKSLFWGSLTFKIVSIILSSFISSFFLILNLIIIISSFLYSHKNFRFKSNAFVALLFNFVAGFTTFLFASSLRNFSILNINLLFGAASSGFFLSSIYLMMQIHQTKEDKKRGDESYALIFGKKNALITSIFLIIIAGLLGAYSMYLSSLTFQIIVLAIYMIFGLFFLIKWAVTKNKINDFDEMTKITNYFSFVGIILLIILYIFF